MEQIDYDFGDSGYGRRLELSITKNTVEGIWCDSCKALVVNIPVLCMDVSNGEYSSMSLCQPCISQIFTDFTKEKI
jgi:hypothetical protein